MVITLRNDIEQKVKAIVRNGLHEELEYALLPYFDKGKRGHYRLPESFSLVDESGTSTEHALYFAATDDGARLVHRSLSATSETPSTILDLELLDREGLAKLNGVLKETSLVKTRHT